MAEFRLAHSRMFPKNQIPDKTNDSSTTTEVITTTTKSITKVSSLVSNNVTTSSLNSNSSTSNNKNNLEISSLNSKSNESDAEINSNYTNNNQQNIIIQTNNNNNITSKIITPPPLPQSNLNMNNNQNGIRKLNTFGKLVIQNDNQNKLPTNLLPKNNLNGLNQNETVKILRTSSPNKNSKKGPAPKPPINSQSNDKLAKIIKVNKKDERITLLNANNLYNKNQIKLEGQKNDSPVVETNLTSVNNRSLEATKYTSDLIDKSNYLSTSDISLSSLSIKVD